jgi:A/G-specific adenine glycosylase
LHATAKQIATSWGGRFPSTYDDLMTLKGIGQYTAAAIASFAFNLPEPVVDGNVYRVLARLYGDNTPIDSTTGKKQFREFAAQLLDREDPATHNQAIMEFGALQCTPKSPQCGTCPFVQICIAYRQNRVAELPLKAKKIKVTERFFHYFIFRFKHHIFVKQRTENDIWKKLYDFPLIETDGDRRDPFLSQQWKLWMKGAKFSVQSISGEWKHLLSHQRLHVYFYEIVLQKPISVQHNAGWLKVDEQEFQKLAMPIIIHNYMYKRQKTA